MKTSLKFLVIFTFFLFNTTSSIAQDNQLSPKQNEMMKTQIEIYFDKLELTDEQKPKFEAIIKRYALQFVQLKESNEGRLSKYKTYKTLNENRIEDMKAILSKSQFEDYLVLQKQVQQQMIQKNMK